MKFNAPIKSIALQSTVLICMGIVGISCATSNEPEPEYPVRSSGGHEIGEKDFGRPVHLIAAALGVKPDVFREAFSGVRPARGRGRTGDEAHKNKAALMRVLAPKGVTNELLDEVSNYYRFRPQNGKIWPTKPAKAHALVVDGKITKIIVTDPGSGYNPQPTVEIEGFEEVKFNVKLALSKNLKKNGSIASIEVQTDEETKVQKPKSKRTTE
jgi:hypothetical protein